MDSHVNLVINFITIVYCDGVIKYLVLLSTLYFLSSNTTGFDFAFHPAVIDKIKCWSSFGVQHSLLKLLVLCLNQKHLLNVRD